MTSPNETIVLFYDKTNSLLPANRNQQDDQFLHYFYHHIFNWKNWEGFPWLFKLHGSLSCRILYSVKFTILFGEIF